MFKSQVFAKRLLSFRSSPFLLRSVPGKFQGSAATGSGTPTMEFTERAIQVGSSKSIPSIAALFDAFHQKLAQLNKESGKAEALRIGVVSGGCHGFQYTFELHDANKPREDDIVFDAELENPSSGSATVRFLVDHISYPYLGGSEIDFVEELIGSSFTISQNPNAESECGCKVSFQAKT